MDVFKPVVSEQPQQKKYKLEIVWFNAIGFAILHLISLYGLYLMFTGHVKLLSIAWLFFVGYIGAIGATMGAHRLFTHRSYKANLGVRLALITAFTIAGQNCLWVWVRDHRQHHKYSDTDGDPHNASRGFFFSHIGWLMVRKQPEVIEYGKKIDMSDMNADPLVMFQKKYYKTLFTIFSIAIPTLVPYYFWNEDLMTSFLTCFITRLIITLNAAWSVNSAAHIYGNKPFTKDMLPTENEFVSFLAVGEGWHNYHHSFPWDYRAAELGQHYNLTGSIIDFCKDRGWVWDLKYATPEMVRHRIMKKGDGTHHLYGRQKKEDDENNNEEGDYDNLKREAEMHDENGDIIDKSDKRKENDDTIIDENEQKTKIIDSLYKLVDI